ncbi:hypothetical protein [Streptomyces albireticuli]
MPKTPTSAPAPAPSGGLLRGKQPVDQARARNAVPSADGGGTGRGDGND